MTKKTAIAAFAAAIESETHITLSPDALQRVILYLCSNTVDPATVAHTSLIAHYARGALGTAARIKSNEAIAGSALHQRINHSYQKEVRDLCDAAESMIRQIAVTKLAAEQLISISSPWVNEQGMAVLPPSAKEWAAMGVEIAAMRQTIEDQSEAIRQERSKELIVTTQEVTCDGCEGRGKRMGLRCYNCNGTGKREIEIARNKPAPTQDAANDASELWEAKVTNNGYNPTARRAFIDGYMYATANAED